MAPKNNEAYSAALELAGEMVEMQSTRTIGQVTERVSYHVQESTDGKWIRVIQREYTPMMGFLAWPISPQKMDYEARKINSQARVVDDRVYKGQTNRCYHVRTYRVS